MSYDGEERYIDYPARISELVAERDALLAQLSALAEKWEQDAIESREADDPVAAVVQRHDARDLRAALSETAGDTKSAPSEDEARAVQD